MAVNGYDNMFLQSRFIEESWKGYSAKIWLLNNYFERLN